VCTPYQLTSCVAFAHSLITPCWIVWGQVRLTTILQNQCSGMDHNNFIIWLLTYLSRFMVLYCVDDPVLHCPCSFPWYLTEWWQAFVWYLGWNSSILWPGLCELVTRLIPPHSVWTRVPSRPPSSILSVRCVSEPYSRDLPIILGEFYQLIRANQIFRKAKRWRKKRRSRLLGSMTEFLKRAKILAQNRRVRNLVFEWAV